jgi:hypothetical protein
MHRKSSEMYVFYFKKKVRNLGGYFQSDKFFQLSSDNCYMPPCYSCYGALISVSRDLV